MITDVQIVTIFNKPSDVSMKEIFADQPGDAEESHEKNKWFRPKIYF